MKNNFAVIMAGGVGSRFWPLSTSSKPKQFLDVLGTGRTLLQLTFDRISKLCSPENILIVTSVEYVQLVQDQLPEIPFNNILKEPARKNTAPCVAYGCYKILAKNPEAKILVAPSDHLILKETEYLKVISEGFQAAENDVLFTLGIQTTRPDTGYGYIKASEEILNGYSDIKKVDVFTEKPALELAIKYHADKTYYWNSGMFIWSAKSIVNSFENHCPELHQLFDQGKGVYNTDKEQDFIESMYPNCKSISVDYAIMEKAKNVYVLPCDIGWTDLGTWGSLYGIVEKNENANAVVGKSVRLYESENCIIANDTNQLVVLQGLNDFIVVNTESALLVCKKQEEQKIKDIVNDLTNSEFKNLV